MNNFEFHNTTRIIFGKDTHKHIGEVVKQYGNKILLHYGGGSIKANGVYDDTIRSLNEANVNYIELGGVLPNPRLSLVYEGIKLCREHQIDFILAVGGGSVIDSAKAIAIGTHYEGDVWDFFSKGISAEAAIKVGSVLTIPAAGSESSNSCVITKEDGGFKRGYSSKTIIPEFAILNPEICFTLPDYQLGCGVADIMAHIMERYFTNTTHTDLTDRLCEATMKTVIQNTLEIKKNNKDYNAWAELMWAGTIAHNGLLGTGRQEDWASHGIEHELSGAYDIAHGAGLAIIFPAWMKYVYTENIARFVQFGVRVFDLDPAGQSLEVVAQESIRRLESFFSEIGLATRLTEVNIDDSLFDEMAEKAIGDYTMGSFKRLNKKDIKAIYELAR